jgi:hypothetical protein
MPDPPDKRGIDAEDAAIAQRPAKRVQYVTLRRSPWVLLIARTNGVVGSAEEFGARITFNEINIIVGPVHPSFPDLANFGMHYMAFCKKSRRWPLAVLAARSKEATIYRSWIHGGKVDKVIR